ncbi:MAG: DUF4476 domain-containing protein [Planctomycetota bacterium]
MRFRRHAPPLVLAALLAAACSSGPRPFADAFPEPRELLTTQDPEGAYQQLQQVAIPADEAHRRTILDLLRSVEHIDAAHMALLAAAMGGRQFRVAQDDTGVFAWRARGGDGAAAATDELLQLGLERLRDVDRRSFGRLLGHTQSDAVLRAYVDRKLASVDDGSVAALQEILGGMTGSPATMPFVRLLAERSALAGARGDAAFDSLVFDDDRVAVLAALLTRPEPLDGERCLTMLRRFSFDEGRVQAFALLGNRFPELTPEQTGAAVATFTFDSGKEAAFASLAQADGLRLRDTQLLDLVRLCLFDDSKLRCVRLLGPKLASPFDPRTAEHLLRAFSFDSDRLRALELLAPHWRGLDGADKARLRATFLFDSAQEHAAELL